ncbi:hypothetical protein ACWD5Q_24520 [Streptomyces sp. NPDC002513]
MPVALALEVGGRGDGFADGWSVELGDPVTGDVIRLDYDVQPMPAPIC